LQEYQDYVDIVAGSFGIAGSRGQSLNRMLKRFQNIIIHNGLPLPCIGEKEEINIIKAKSFKASLSFFNISFSIERIPYLTCPAINIICRDSRAYNERITRQTFESLPDNDFVVPFSILCCRKKHFYSRLISRSYISGIKGA